MTVRNKAIRTKKSTASRRVVTNRSGHFTGYYFSMKNSRVIQYESILERDYIYLIETDRGVKSYTEQPEKLVWLDGTGKENETTFDFCVERAATT
ncbi:hypothetical protein [Rhodopseudomonas sp.]|uniref:hypothetical protein n=1 Tax=Rhodopseudomonas sp. TaxID=1078 RepID=UPI0039E3735A